MILGLSVIFGLALAVAVILMAVFRFSPPTGSGVSLLAILAYPRDLINLPFRKLFSACLGGL